MKWVYLLLVRNEINRGGANVTTNDDQLNNNQVTADVATFQMCLTQFLASNFYQQLIAEVPTHFVKTAIATFNQTMQTRFDVTVTQWRSSEVVQLLDEQWQQTTSSSQDIDLFLTTYSVTRCFVLFLADEQLIEEDFGTLSNVLLQFEVRRDIQETEPIREHRLTDRRMASLEELSREMQQQVENFVASPGWQRVPAQVHPNDAYHYVAILYQQLYINYHQLPQDWTQEAVRNVLLNDFVLHVGIPVASYQLIGPTLTAFLNYLATVDYLSMAQAEQIVNVINAVATQMTHKAARVARWREQ